MSGKMTQRENYLAAARGETPRWVPNYNDDIAPVDPMILNTAMTQYFIALEEYQGNIPKDTVFIDGFGIRWLVDDMGPMVDTAQPLVLGIEKWRDTFIIPETENYDWDAAAEIDGMFVVDDKVSQMFIYGPFMIMLNAFGHEEAFITLYSDPEEAAEFLDVVTSFLETMVENVFTRVRVDSFVLHNDMANPSNLFIPPETYREVVKPFDKRIFDTIRRVSPDTVIEYHICGKADSVIDDIVEIGSDVWQPAQPMNDLVGIKKKYGQKLIFNGAWDNVTMLAKSNVTEEEIRQSVRETIDEQTADGMPYIFWDGGPYGSDPEINKRCEWANDEARIYGATAYLEQAKL